MTDEIGDGRRRQAKSASWEFGRASDDEALRLVVAFLGIQEPERRGEILDLAERYHSVTIRREGPTPPVVAQDNKRRP